MPYEKTGKETRCIVDKIPFEIPDSWEWVRCGSLFFVNPRNTMSDDALVGFMPMPMLCDGFQNKHSFETKKWGEVKNGFTHFADGDIVIAKITPCFQNRKSAIIAGLPNSCGAGTTELHVLRDLSNCLFMPFFLWLFKTHHFIEEGKKHFSGTAGQQRIGKDFIATYMIPLPPLAEQKRIVAKIEELLPHLDEYDQAETRVEKLNAEFPEQLKKSILQWAIQGKLVPQDPNDEPASVLLDRIRAEKAKLVKVGKLKKDKTESVIFRRDNSHYEKLNGVERCIDDEIPFEIPDSWMWIRLGQLCEIARGGSPRPIKDFITDAADGINWIKIGDSDKGGKYISRTKEKIKPSGVSKSRMVHAGDFLLTNSMSFGRPYILNIDGCIHDGWLVLSGYQTVFDQDFLFLMLSSPFAYQQFCGIVSGAVVKNLNRDKVAESLFPLPPFAEQKRIVEAIELLLCKLSV